MPKCLLCSGLNSELICKIKTREIVRIYKRLFAVDIAKFFGDHEIIEYYQCNDCNLLFYNPIIVGDQLLYDHMQQFEWYYSKNKNEFEFAKQFIRPDDFILEVGCGSGWFSRLISDNKYTGLELSKKAQLMASQVRDNVHVQTIEEHAIIARQKYDVVCSFQVLEHAENPESFIRSCISCLKPGGVLIISVPSEDSFLTIVEDGILNMPPHHITRWPDKTLIWLANNFSLEIISLKHEQLDDIHVHGYATELIRAVIKSIFHLEAEVISTALSHRFLTLICQILGKFYSQILSNPNLRPVGQSVTLVSKIRQ